MLKLVWLIPVLPLFGFLFSFLLGRKLRLSERTVSLIACGVILASMLLTLGAFYFLVYILIAVPWLSYLGV